MYISLLLCCAVCIYLFVFFCIILPFNLIDYWISTNSFNRGNFMCYICKSAIFQHENAFFHKAAFHVDCLNHIGNCWIATLEFDSVAFFVDVRKLNIGKHWVWCLKRSVISLFGSRLGIRFFRLSFEWLWKSSSSC